MTAQVALRNVSSISLHKIAQLAGAFGFAVIIPRSLGPDLFGQLSFVLALSLILQMPGDLGGMDIFGRFVPRWQDQEGGRRKITWLTAQMNLLRLAFGLVITISLMPLAPVLAPWLQPTQGFLIGIAVLIRMLTWTPFHLSFGLNRMGRWAVELSYRQLVMIPFLLLLLPWGLNGLLVGLILSEMVFLIIGIVWTRDFLTIEAWNWSELRPYLRFGMGFFIANVILVALYRSSPVLLELLSRDTAAVGHLNLALSVYMMVIVVFTHYVASMVPSLVNLLHGQNSDEATRWVDRILRYSTVVMGLMSLGMILLGYALAPLLFGSAYVTVGQLMIPLGLALMLQPVIWTVRYAATAYGHPRIPFWASLLAAITMFTSSLILIPRMAAIGAVLGLVSGISAMAMCYIVLSRTWLPISLRPWLLSCLPLFALVPLIDPARSLGPSLAIAFLASVLYLGLILGMRVLPLKDLQRLFHPLIRRARR